MLKVCASREAARSVKAASARSVSGGRPPHSVASRRLRLGSTSLAPSTVQSGLQVIVKRPCFERRIYLWSLGRRSSLRRFRYRCFCGAQKRPRSWQNPIVDILWTPAIIGLALARPRSISHISGSCAVTMVPANSPTYRDFLHPLVAPWSTQTERSSKMCIVDHCRQHRPCRPPGSTEMLD